MSPRPFTVSVDFDGTIHNEADRAPGYKMGKPFDGAVQTLNRLREMGAKIIIFTCRARAPHGQIDPDYEQYVSTVDHVADWLDYFGIPFDDITALKPVADVYLDDKAVPFDGDWSHAEREILSVFYLGARS